MRGPRDRRDPVLRDALRRGPGAGRPEPPRARARPSGAPSGTTPSRSWRVSIRSTGARRGLADFGRPGNYYARQLHRWVGQYRASETETIPAMERLIEWLPAHVPGDDTTTLVHGDFRIGNTVVHPTEPRILAVLDWELSTLGHPLGDLGYLCTPFRMPPGIDGFRGLDLGQLGIPSEAEVVARYCRADRPRRRSPTGSSTSPSPCSGWPRSARGSWAASGTAPPATPTRAGAASARGRWPTRPGRSWTGPHRIVDVGSVADVCLDTLHRGG